MRRLGSGDTSGSCEADIPGERTRTDDFDISDQFVDDGQGSGSCVITSGTVDDLSTNPLEEPERLRAVANQ